jgi:uncharacterized protein (TIGR00251 family)
MTLSATINVKLKPKASRCAIKVCGTRNVEVWVTSPPVDNRANEHLVEFLAGVLGIGKTSLRIVKGGRSRNKVVEVTGIAGDDVDRALSTFLAVPA